MARCSDSQVELRAVPRGGGEGQTVAGLMVEVLTVAGRAADRRIKGETVCREVEIFRNHRPPFLRHGVRCSR